MHIIKNYIAERVLQAVGPEISRGNLCQFQIASLLKIQKFCPVTKTFLIQLPIKSLQNLREFKEKVPSLLNIKPDSTIKNVSFQNENRTDEKVALFSVHGNVFIKNVFTSDAGSTVVQTLPKQYVAVEYSSPNIAKPFHMGHLRSTILGDFVSNIQKISKDVVRLNYLGDWGTQVGLVYVGLKKFHLDNSQLNENPIKTMYEAYVKANKEPGLLESARSTFSKLERGEDEEGLKHWEMIRCKTMSHLETTYKELGVTFDEYAWESSYRAPKIEHVIAKLENKGLIKKKNEQLNIELDGQIVPLLKSDGSSLYLSRDIAAALDRLSKFNCDLLLYIVDKSQSEHLEFLRKVIINLIGKDVIRHIPFGRVIGMSTRKGTSIFLSDILAQAIDVMAAQQEKSPNTKSSSPEVTKVLAVSALKSYFLKQRRMKDFRFDWEIALQGKGDTGVKLQYTHSRLCSLEKNCGVNLPKFCEPEFLVEPEALELIAELSRFGEILQSCEKDLESSVLINYLFKVCNLTSRCLKNLTVKGEASDLAEQRLLMFSISRKIISKGMKILGLQPLEMM